MEWRRQFTSYQTDWMKRESTPFDISIYILQIPHRYDRILARIQAFDDRERNETKRVLSMIASCEVPLTKTEVQLGVYISLGGDPLQGCERLLMNICRRCGPIIEEVDGYIQFVHFTAYEYV